jgi:SAM-dependent methyltransferase
VTEEDRRRWDDRYGDLGAGDTPEPAPPSVLAPFVELLPTGGAAVEVACGPGRAAVWLALRGFEVVGYDVSPVAIDAAEALARRSGVEDRCDFIVADLDHGLPDGEPADLVLCHLFHDPVLAEALVDRLLPGGTLAVACLSQVGGSCGRFRAPPGELLRCYGSLDVLVHGEADGHAWLIARRPMFTSGSDTKCSHRRPSM